MNCKSFEKLASEFYDGTLEAPAREECQAHATTCKNCQRLLDELENLSLMVKDLLPVKAPNNFDFELLERIGGSERGKEPRRPVWHFLQGLRAPAMAMVLLVMVGGILYLQRSRIEPPRPNLQVVKAPGISGSNQPVQRESIESAESMGFQEVLLRSAGDEEVILRLPRTIRINAAADVDNDEYIKNISH